MPAARVTMCPSLWRVHRFEVWSGERVCAVEALRMQDSLLLWLGAAGAGAALGEVALGAGGAATALRAGGAGEARAEGLARRLSAALARPVHVCFSAPLDRFTAPLLERALVAEIKSRPECF
ncbi:uncharacterized protein LOC119694922 [Plutella xylostella]|uniref:uncharacterized protein LOC119694922 n=1 Tax=Plutella xylostella TaxID=51655 RepID=UPI0020322A9F|nr:uncharacterized protein LOC119694922 [Plutella xylostella]XP_037978443.2 uncharacterized protein LOC119694922 [Plutella xylostella]